MAAVNLTQMSEADLTIWLTNFRTAMGGTVATTMGLTTAEVGDLMGVLSGWLSTYAAHVAAQDAARAARQAKDDGKDALLVKVRAIVARLQAAPAMTDAIRQTLGITVRDHEPTTSMAMPLSEIHPVLQISTAQAQRHVISFTDAGTPTKKAKPAGIHHAEIFCKVDGPAPANDDQWVYLASDSATPYLAEYDLAQTGTTVYYRARWVNTRGEKGPWGAMAQAKVPG